MQALVPRSRFEASGARRPRKNGRKWVSFGSIEGKYHKCAVVGEWSKSLFSRDLLVTRAGIEPATYGLKDHSPRRKLAERSVNSFLSGPLVGLLTPYRHSRRAGWVGFGSFLARGRVTYGLRGRTR